MKKAIILCSGGLDSVVTAHHVRKQLGFEKITLLFFNYGQRGLTQERNMSLQCAKDIGAEFYEMHLPELSKISTSTITQEKDFSETEDLSDTREESAQWYVPCRNLIFLSFAIGLAEHFFLQEKCDCDIFVGFKNDGDETFPDASKEFVQNMNQTARCAQGKICICAPLIEKDKEDIVLLGSELQVDFRNTFSCYVGEKNHCGKCLACTLRQQGFYWAHVEDPTRYDYPSA